MKIHLYFQKCWPYTHASVARERKQETANPMIKTYFTREEENTMVRVEDNIRERVREHNNNVNMWYSGEGVERGSEGYQKHRDVDFMEDCEGF